MSIASQTTADVAIVLMGHGSRDREGSDEFLTFAHRLATRLQRPLYPGFLELADPPIVAAIDEAVQAGARTIIAIPWLLLGAGHVKNDLPVAFHLARQRYPQISIHYGNPLTVQPEILSVLGDRLAAIDPARGVGSPDTAVLLVQRGSSDPEANAEVYRVARLLWEGRSFRAVEVAFSGITQPTIQEGLERCCATGVRRVLVVPYFLFTGILVKRIPQIVAQTAGASPYCEVRIAKHLGLDDRLEELAQRMVTQVQRGKATMTCDLCQYRTPLFGREARVGLPSFSDHTHGRRGFYQNHQPTRACLPPRYQGETVVSAAPMGSAPLLYTDEGQVAWDQMWTSFCDLALAGGPAHRGTLLEPVLPEEALSNPAGYEQVVAEIERGWRLVTGLSTVRSATPGWIGLRCSDEEMALWLLRAIVVENVSVRREGTILFLPASPHFQLEEEIKNVITVVAKTHHYWQEHRLA